MVIISGASILQLWQPAQVGTAAEGAAVTVQTPLPPSQPLSSCLDFPRQGWQRICCQLSVVGADSGERAACPDLLEL